MLFRSGVLFAGGSTFVAPLANDSDPAGGVLVVQSIEVPDDLEITLLDRHLLRVSAPAGLDAPVSVPYTVSNGQASATARVTVVPAPAEDDKRPPQLQPDSARVRVGDVGGVDVLSNDVSSAGLNLTIDPHRTGHRAHLPSQVAGVAGGGQGPGTPGDLDDDSPPKIGRAHV